MTILCFFFLCTRELGIAILRNSMMARGVQPDRVNPIPGSAHPENRVGNQFRLKLVREPVPKTQTLFEPVREPVSRVYPPGNRIDRTSLGTGWRTGL